jgi:hypothetical protein
MNGLGRRLLLNTATITQLAISPQHTKVSQ